jgi:hypothetical protein
MLLIQQVLDGPFRMIHHLPYHVRKDLHTSLQIFAAFFKLRETILLINAAAIVQPPLQLDQGARHFLILIFQLCSQINDLMPVLSLITLCSNIMQPASLTPQQPQWLTGKNASHGLDLSL